MIGQRYREQKIAVLDAWSRYRSVRGTTEDGVDLAFLDQRAKALEEGRYVLAVVGEAKAGKSTLINALLGERILPTDVLQSSSAIVEIFKSDEKFVEVQYADDHSERVRDDLTTPDVDEAFKYLRKIGALQDDFRRIPTALIDSYIVEGRISPGAPIPVAELQEVSGLPLSGKEELVTEYIKDRTLAKIPVKITFGFPLKYALDDLRLVDSPGVNALGGVQERTFAYLRNANAVLFVHPLEGPVEQQSLRKFITDVVPSRTRQALFLVLSKSGRRSEITIKRMVSEARSLYSGQFDPQRVIHIDAMLKIVSDEIQGFDSALALKRHYTGRRQHYSELFLAEPRQEWAEEEGNFDTKLRLLNDTLEATGAEADTAVVQRELRRRSNFDVLEHAIEEFSAKAAELQLSELLAAIRRGYENQVDIHEQTIELLEKKKQHPQVFEAEINRNQALLRDYQRLMNEFADRVVSDYTGRRASFQHEREEIKTSYVRQIHEASSNDVVKKILEDFNDANCSFVDRIANQIRRKFEAELIQRGAEFKEKHSFTIPEVDIAGIEANAKEASYRKAEVPRESEGFLEWALERISFGLVKYTKTERVLDQRLFLEKFKSLATKRVVEVSKDYKLIRELIGRFDAGFRRSVKKLVEARQKAYEEIKARKETNDQILRKIEEERKKKEIVCRELAQVLEILEDLR